MNLNNFNNSSRINLQSKEYLDKLKQTSENIWDELISFSHCSAFIKLTENKEGKIEDLLAGHTTWADYYEVLRIFKHYLFEFDGNSEDEENSELDLHSLDDLEEEELNGFYSNSKIPSTEMTFSGYPAAISSTDDYYITNNQLLIMETTIEIIDADKFRYVKNHTEFIPNFMRVLYATRFSTTAAQWPSLFNFYNSGTYSSQWMIIDYNKFKEIKGKKLSDLVINKNINENNLVQETLEVEEGVGNSKIQNILFVVEQDPIRIISHDITTHLLKQTYFGSYNRAFFDETNLDLNTSLIRHLYGDYLGSIKKSNRARIFQYFQGKIHTLKDLIKLLRYNNYQGLEKNGFVKDPSLTNPSHAISARFDLHKKKNIKKITGGIDTKATSSEMIKDYRSIVINGPSEMQQTFKFSNKTKHRGIPDEIDFPYIVIDKESFIKQK